MSRRVAIGIIVAAVVLAAGLLLLWPGGEEEPAETVTPDLETPLEPPPVEDAVEVDLFFPDAGGLLTAETRQMPPWMTPDQGARLLLEALLAGPQTPELLAPMPAEVTLGAIYLTEDGVLYVDLMSTELVRPPTTGSQQELMAVWSLVDTVGLGVPEVESVVLLWNSRQLTSFAGHVDTSLPLSPDTDLIRGGR